MRTNMSGDLDLGPRLDSSTFVDTIPDKANSRDRGEGGLCQGIKRVLSNYGEQCSTSGVSFIKGSKHPVVKGIWCCLLAVAIVCMVVHLCILLGMYFDFPRNTDFEIEFRDIPFPAVTFCNVNPIRMSKLLEAQASMEKNLTSEGIEALLAQWELQQVPDLLQSDDTSTHDMSSMKSKISDRAVTKNISPERVELQKAMQNSWEAESEPSGTQKIQSSFRTFFAHIPGEIRSEMGHQIDDMLLQCSFNGGMCRPEHFTLSLSSKYGNCYTIESDKFITRNSGPFAGLDLILFQETDEYLDGLTNGVGVQLVIHEQNTLPVPDTGVAIAGGTLNFVGLVQTEIYRLDSPHGECTSGVAFLERYGIKYTRSVCYFACKMEMVANKCGCVDDLGETLTQKYKDMYQPCFIDKDIVCAMQVKWHFDQVASRLCDCESPCKEVKYAKTISSRSWPRPFVLNNIVQAMCGKYPPHVCQRLENKTIHELDEEFVQIKVYFETLNYEQVKEKEAYAPARLVSDIGGTIGLWIGLSILCLFEVFHLIIELLVFVWRWWRHGRSR